MKKYATLLIQHMETMYTMEESKPLIHHGFLAIHHDRILAYGEGDGSQYMDKDTRILEGRGHIVIPAFCDVNLSLCEHSLTQNDLGDQIRHMLECSQILMKHGTLIGNQTTPFTSNMKSLLEVFSYPHMFDVMQQSNISYPVLYPFETMELTEQTPFCISCGYPKKDMLDQLLCAKWVYHQYHLPPEIILKACTIYPAKALSLRHLGQIKKGYIANVLMLQGNNVEQVFARFHGEEHIQVIKEGTRILPSILI